MCVFSGRCKAFLPMKSTTLYIFRWLTGAKIKCDSSQSIRNVDLPCLESYYKDKIIFNFTFEVILNFKIIKLTFCVFHSRKLL